MLLIAVLAGCTKKDEKAADTEKKPQKQTQVQATGKEKQRIHTAHYLEEEVEILDEVRHATVLVEGRDAYVALEFVDTEFLLNEEVKNKIVDQIRTTDPDIDNIHLSHNMDFNTRMHSLARDIERGLPEKAIGDSFRKTVRRVFPELKK